MCCRLPERSTDDDRQLATGAEVLSITTVQEFDRPNSIGSRRLPASRRKYERSDAPSSAAAAVNCPPGVKRAKTPPMIWMRSPAVEMLSLLLLLLLLLLLYYRPLAIRLLQRGLHACYVGRAAELTEESIQTHLYRSTTSGRLGVFYILLLCSYFLPHAVNCGRFCFWRRQSVGVFACV